MSLGARTVTLRNTVRVAWQSARSSSLLGKIMAVNVETLEKLERKITLSVPLSAIQSEVDARLKKVARTVKMDGFRPARCP
jgi:hypothetical protein